AGARPTAATARRAPGPAPPHVRQVPRRRQRIGRKPVHLGLVQQQEEGAESIDAVGRIVAVQPGATDPGPFQSIDAVLSRDPQLVQRPELDRLGRARLGASRLVAIPYAVIAKGALPDATIA